MDETLLVIATVDVRFRPSLAVVDEHLVRALDAELTYRKAKGYRIARVASMKKDTGEKIGGGVCCLNEKDTGVGLFTNAPRAR